MAFCPKCGTEHGEEIKFCGNCGNNLDESSTEGNFSVGKNRAENLLNSSISSVNINFDNVKNLFINMLKKPATATANFCQDADKHTMIFTSILVAVLSGLIAILNLKLVISNLDRMISRMLSSAGGAMASEFEDFDFVISMMASYFEDFGVGLGEMLNLPYGRIFIQYAIIFIVMVGIMYCSCYFLTQLICKVKVDIKKLYSIILAASIIILYSCLASTLLSMINIYLGTIVALFGYLMFLLNVVNSISETFEIRGDKINLIIALAVIITLIAVVLITKSFIESDIIYIQKQMINSFNF